MPAYGTYPALALSAGDTATVWSAESPAPGAGGASASQALALYRDTPLPQAVSAEVVFAGNPGAFEVDLQTSDTNIDADYVTKAQLTAANANFVGRMEVSPVRANFVRLLMASRANAVAVTARISA